MSMFQNSVRSKYLKSQVKTLLEKRWIDLMKMSCHNAPSLNFHSFFFLTNYRLSTTKSL